MARGARSMCAPNLPAGAASQPASLCFQFRLRELDGGTCCCTPEPVGQQPRRITGDSSDLLRAEEQERKEQACLLCSGTQSLSFILI